MAETVAALDRPPATPQEIWAILRDTAERQKTADERQKAAAGRLCSTGMVAGGRWIY